MQSIKSPERFWIPNLPELCNVLQLPGDLFSVKPNELVRKAIDEMTYGMHYYVLFTLIHSAAKEQPNKNYIQNPIKFSYTNTPKLNEKVEFEKKESGEIKMKKDMKPDDFKKEIQKYLGTAATKDFRSILNHIKITSNGNVEYYTDKSRNTVKVLHQCARFFYHRNYLVFENLPSENYDLEITSLYKVIAEQEMKMARYFFDTDFFTDLPNEWKPIKDQIKWQENVCFSLIKAARNHLENAQKIKKVFSRIFSEKNSEKNMQDLLNNLNNFKDNHNEENKGLHQFVVYAMWTRFGTNIKEQEQIGNNDENDEDNGSFIKNKEKDKRFKNLKVARVVRHKIDIEKLTDNFIQQENIFFADPIGITHLDVLNRAIDISQLAIRRILHDALIQPKKAELKTTQQKNRDIVFKNLKDLKDKKLVREILDQEKNLYVFKEEDVRVNLFEDFKQRMADKSKAISNFVYLSPYFADPRFVGEFLVRQTDINGIMLFPLAGDLIRIRDDASHQLNLHSPGKLNKQSLQTNISKLINIIEEVAKKLGIDEENMIEMKALNQLNDNFSLYLNWRKRQGFVLKMYDESFTKISYKEVSKQMIEFLFDSKGQLDKVDENDNSQQAIEYILSILQFQAINSCQNDQLSPSAELKTSNPFDVLNDEFD